MKKKIHTLYIDIFDLAKATLHLTGHGHSQLHKYYSLLSTYTKYENAP